MFLCKVLSASRSEHRSNAGRHSYFYFLQPVNTQLEEVQSSCPTYGTRRTGSTAINLETRNLPLMYQTDSHRRQIRISRNCTSTGEVQLVSARYGSTRNLPFLKRLGRTNKKVGGHNFRPNPKFTLSDPSIISDLYCDSPH